MTAIATRTSMKDHCVDTLETPLAGTSDEELLQAWQSEGRQEAFGELARRHQHSAYRVAYAWSGIKHQAEEAVQEAFVKLLRPGFGPGPGVPFRPWFLGVVANVARHVHRTEKRARQRVEKTRLTAKAAAMEESKPVAGVSQSDAEAQVALTRALSDLDERHRVPLILHFMEGLTQAEIGKLAGVSQSQVARRISQGLALLRSRLAQTGIAMSAVMLPGMLSSPQLLQAPAALQQALAHPDFLTAAASESMRTAAVHAGLSIKAKLALVALLLVVASGVFYAAFKPQAPAVAVVPAAPAAAEVKPQSEPAPEAFATRRWSFAAGPQVDFKVRQGTWEWMYSKEANTGLMLSSTEGLFVDVPFKWPARPMHIKANCIIGRTNQWAMHAWYMHEKGVEPHKRWLKYQSMGVRSLKDLFKPMLMEVYLFGPYEITCIDGKPYAVHEYSKPYPTDTSVLVFKTLGVVDIEISELDMQKLPEALKNLPALCKQLAAEPSHVDASGRVIPSDTK